MADPDLQIRGGGGGRRSPDPEIRGKGPGLQNKFFQPFGPQIGLKIRGPGSPGPSPRSVTVIYKVGR